ncbi:hypothetical protein [Candidatus Frankia nodulisporulans]|uniref:hypothetical protein n=1 Tax=Candidatus Frankia nodulisporulans TaxID=2060052 RepID=UPI0013D2D11C|nr:hypothetical protein [Candidatus Frankia nodulisporulans]
MTNLRPPDHCGWGGGELDLTPAPSGCDYCIPASTPDGRFHHMPVSPDSADLDWLRGMVRDMGRALDARDFVRLAALVTEARGEVTR